MSADDKLSEASAFAKEVRATFPVVHDKKGPITDKFGVTTMPANVVLDRAGKVVYSLDGPDLPALEKAINTALAAKK